MDVLTTPKLPLADWLAVMEREYLSAFVPAGGAAVKFAVLVAVPAGVVTLSGPVVVPAATVA